MLSYLIQSGHSTFHITFLSGFPGGHGGKEPTCPCRRHKRHGSVPRSGRSPAKGNGKLLHSCLENLLDRGLNIYELSENKHMHVSHSVVSYSLQSHWTVACQPPLSMEFSRQEYWSGLPFPSPEDLPNAGIKPWFPALQADSLPFELWEVPKIHIYSFLIFFPECV